MAMPLRERRRIIHRGRLGRREREKRRRCVCTSSGVLARRLEEVHIKLGDPIVVLSWPTRLRHTIEQNAGTPTHSHEREQHT